MGGDGEQDLPRGAKNVRDALRRAGVEAAVLVLPDSTRTAAAAAEAVGCEVGAIANSLIFMADGVPLLVMTSGAHRVNTTALAARIGVAKIARATPEQVREATGQVIGGVSPVGHPRPVHTVVDETLADYGSIWAAAGTANALFRTSFDELCRLTSGQAVDVT